ncbi:MAG: GNAT family N-acetyltransferase [Spirochaetaceae bacterium]|jgi:GNAT superfamily N-acetyltransferase|nr:GNAT family N-acetyltransferase [Spirochaetaceae bacterium]
MAKDFEIVDLSEQNFEDFCCCLTPEDETIHQAGDKKAQWLKKRKDNDFGAKIARLADGSNIGMIQYLPIEESTAQGENLYFVQCIWIPPKKRNQAGQQRKKGVGKTLLKAAEEDVRQRGAAGLVVWGTLGKTRLFAGYYGIWK